MTVSGMEYFSAAASLVVEGTRPLGGLDALLSAAEQNASSRFRRESDALSYRAAHALFRLMAARRLGSDPRLAAALRVYRRCRTCGGEHGKPSIDGVQLSLSRSAGIVIVASSPEGSPVGADIEQLPSRIFDGFDAYALTSREREHLPSRDAAARIRLWVAKEAALKTTGHGLAVEPGTLSVHDAGGTDGSWTATVIQDSWRSALSELDQVRIMWPQDIDGYATALATVGSPEVRRLRLGDLLHVA